MSCGHTLCELIGGACSLVAGLSRGCQTGLRPRTAIAPEVFEEIRGLLATLDDDATARAAAVRLAAIVRREAREGRGVVAQAREDAPELVPRLAALCARNAT
jgi:hypothetical protein